ncbi:Protein CBG04547 [Caenorhabditis briggsae]|nr:Protein CBG04547 [Caenorhabditis briggsae]PIC28624.1 hypothetical protein B9Z55_020475 [Caenorhabditis nigoni]ULT91204.1 hypothetical protein L3Y34_009066 [Caenorhabditis briggsae]UMM36969.1 hypothetical protein L5515_008896 [Caenorhabditis briggsae]CAP25223.1 Protein CBG04547 [Caenorhabditis briggsae]
MSILYEDEYVRLGQFTLFVKNYHFPTKKTKSVSLEAITTLWFEEQETCKSTTTKIWGKASAASIYWALDVKRSLGSLSPRSPAKSNVVVEVGAKLRVGFSVENIDEFMDAIRTLLDYHVIIVNYINLP